MTTHVDSELLELQSSRDLTVTDIEPSEPMSRNEHYWTARAMIKYGGSFMAALGATLRCADDVNREKIKETWLDDWERYKKIGEEMHLEDRRLEGRE